MKRRLLTILAAALVQACASTPPPAELEPHTPTPAVSAPPPAPAAARPAEPVPPPAPPPAPAVVLETAKLPPFDGERRVINVPLRGIKQVDGTAGPHDV